MGNKEYIYTLKYCSTNIFIWIKQFIIIYFFWIIIHIISANLYVYFCAQPTIRGIFYSVLTTQTPHCIAIRSAIDSGISIINSMWSVMAVWASSKFLK